MAGSTLAIALYLAGSTVAWLAARWRGRQGGREGVRSTRVAKSAVEPYSGLTILGGEAQRGRTTRGLDMDELIP